MSRHVTHARAFIAVTILVTVAVAGCAQGPVEIDPWETIDNLRASGDFEGALVVVHEVLVECTADSKTPAYETGDARREVETLERIVQLGPAEQAEMAEAARRELEAHEHWYANEYAEAAAAARRCLELSRRHLGARHHETADAAQLYAVQLNELGELAAAEELYSFADEVYNDTFEPIHPGREALLTNWALVLAKVWRRDEELARLRWALAMAKELYTDIPAYIAVALNNVGVSLMETGRFGESREMLTEALKIREEHGSPDEVLQAQLNLTTLDYEEGDLDRAREQLDLALDLVDRDSTLPPSLVAATLKLKAILLFEAQDYAGSERIQRQVLSIRQTVWPERSSFVAISHVDLGAALYHLGRFDEADAEFAMGIPTLEEVDDRNLPGLVWAYPIRADRYWFAGDYERATIEYARAAQVYEETRFKLGVWGSRSIFDTPWFGYAASLLMCGRQAEAWHALEAGQGRLLADALQLRRHDDLESGETATLRRLTSEADTARRSLIELPTDEADVGEKSVTFSDAIERLRAAEAALATYCTDLSRTIIEQSGRSLSLERVQDALGPDEAILGWLQLGAGGPTARAWGYVVRDSGPVHWVADLPIPTALGQESAAQQCAMAIWKDVAWQTFAATAWQERFAPLLPHLDGVTRLIVAPTGDMLGVPVEALGPLDQEKLGDRYQVSYTPSAEVLVRLRAHDDAASATDTPMVLALGDPPFNSEQLEAMRREESSIIVAQRDRPMRGRDHGHTRSELLRNGVDHDQQSLALLDRLPRSRSEALAVVSLGGTGSLALIGPECSEQRLIDLARSNTLREFDVIHIATHAIVHPFAPRRSGLVLSQLDLPAVEAAGNEALRLDGVVTVLEIATTWQLDARLVALTGCETGLGRHQLGEGFLGFTNVFLQQGADAVLVSLWPVGDRSTELLVKRFYELYLGDRSAERSKVACLQEAKIWLRQQVDELNGERLYTHPGHWAGLVLVGNPD